MNTVIIGLGYVGLTYSIFISNKKNKVIGIDINKNTLDKIINKNLSFFEEGLDIELEKSIDSGYFEPMLPDQFIDLNRNLESTNIFIVTVGTPVEEKKVQLDSIENVFSLIKAVIKKDDAIILRSTVEAGLTRKMCSEIKEDIYYCFAPERTIEGNTIEELNTLPQIYGADDERSKNFFNDYFSLFHDDVVSVTNSETAEIIKLSSNVFRDVSFAFANEIAQISFNHGVSSREVIDTCNYKYPRSNIPKSGPVAGPCLSKDSYIFVNDTHRESVILSARKLNEEYCWNILDSISNENDFKNACVLGIAFKGNPGTSDVRDSMALSLNKSLKDKGINVSGFDPLVFDEDFEKNNIKRINSYKNVFESHDLIIVQNNNPMFSKIDLTKYDIDRPITIVDFWSVIPKKNLKNINHIIL
jgi:nucleotide sugar dehydrogenase